MDSQIKDELSEREQAVLAMYCSTRGGGMKTAVRQSIQYAVGAGVFTCLAIADDQPWYALVSYAVFLLFMGIRLWGAARLSGVMPTIIEKYEARIAAITDSIPKE